MAVPPSVISVWTLGLAGGVLAGALTLAVFEAYRTAVSACQWFLALCASSPPAGGSSAAASPSEAGLAVDRHEGPLAEQPDFYRSSQGRLLSSPLPACSSADLESVAGRLDGRSLGLFGPLAVIDSSPNFSAFGAGVELGIFVALFTISTLLVLNWIVKTMRSSNR